MHNPYSHVPQSPDACGSYILVARDADLKIRTENEYIGGTTKTEKLKAVIVSAIFKQIFVWGSIGGWLRVVIYESSIRK